MCKPRYKPKSKHLSKYLHRFKNCHQKLTYGLTLATGVLALSMLAGCGGDTQYNGITPSDSTNKSVSSSSSSSNSSSSSSNSSSSSSGTLNSGSPNSGSTTRPTALFPLNDSGQTSCTNGTATGLSCPQAAYPGQDAESGRDKTLDTIKTGGGEAGFDLTKVDNNGAPLSQQNIAWQSDGNEADGTHWSCIMDNTTQLVWEVKSEQENHPQYGLSTYSWFNASNENNGGRAGFADGGECNVGLCDTEGYVSYINSIELCGYSDWRVPTVRELLSIGHHGRTEPAIDTHYFPNTLGLRHWTSDAVAAIPQIAWYVYFSDASVSYTDKSNRSVLRLVRSSH